MTRKLDPAIIRIVHRITARYKPSKVILFGSYANGTQKAHSDVDLLIIKNTRKSRVDRFVEVKRLIYDPLSSIPVSPLVCTMSEIDERLRLGDGFFTEIMKKGIVVYDRYGG